jgi:hypothetical protein
MHNLVQPLLLIGIAASATTLLGSAFAWWMDDARRLGRLVEDVLEGPPDGWLSAKGRGAAIGFRLAVDKLVVMRDGGEAAVLYPIHLLIGAELLVDDQVASRVYRGEQRRPLDQIAVGARKVSLLLIFDDPVHPDFCLDLCLPEDEGRRDVLTPPQAIIEGRAWLGRVEALVRRANTLKPPAAAERDHGRDYDHAPEPPPVRRRAHPAFQRAANEPDPMPSDIGALLRRRREKAEAEYELAEEDEAEDAGPQPHLF